MEPVRVVNVIPGLIRGDIHTNGECIHIVYISPNRFSNKADLYQVAAQRAMQEELRLRRLASALASDDHRREVEERADQLRQVHFVSLTK